MPAIIFFCYFAHKCNTEDCWSPVYVSPCFQLDGLSLFWIWFKLASSAWWNVAFDANSLTIKPKSKTVCTWTCQQDSQDADCLNSMWIQVPYGSWLFETGDTGVILGRWQGLPCCLLWPKPAGPAGGCRECWAAPVWWGAAIWGMCASWTFHFPGKNLQG